MIGRFKTWHLAAALALAVALVYLPSVRYSFVSYDDGDYVYQNERVLGGLTPANVCWALTSCGYACNWHPLAWISLQADATLVGRVETDAEFDRLAHVMHAHNVLLHVANAVLLWWLMMVLGGGRPGRELDSATTRGRVGYGVVAAVCALLWAVHPLRTEVVCWISERKELVSVFFMLMTMILYCGAPRGRALPCFILALLAKPVAVTLPGVLFAWEWMVRRRPFREVCLRLLPFAACSLVACGLTMSAQVEPAHVGSQYALWEKLVMAVSAPVIYLRQTVLPTGLSAFYPTHPPVPWVETALGLALVGAMAYVLDRWYGRRERWAAFVSFGIVWAYGALVPMLGIVKVGDQPHSDRYTYWAGCALMAVLAMGARRLAASAAGWTAVKALAAVAVAMAWATWERMPVWRDSLALYADGVPKSWASQPVCALANTVRRQGPDGLRQAEQILRQAAAHTNDAFVTAELANVLAYLIDPSPVRLSDGPDPVFAEVRLLAGAALGTDARLASAHEALGVVSMKEGNWTEAIGHLEKALSADAKERSRIEEALRHCRARCK